MIYVTTSDYHRLSGLIETSRERNRDSDREYLDQLEEELGRAELVQRHQTDTKNLFDHFSPMPS